MNAHPQNQYKNGGGGFEPQDDFTYPIVKAEVTPVNKSSLAIYLATILQKHTDLAAIIESWPTLPEHVKDTIKSVITSCKLRS